jgi:hypothetical protein
MNERLIELYRSCRPKEALASQDEFKSANVLLGSEVEKFAELLIRECVDIIARRKDEAIDNDWRVDEAMSTASLDIMEQFGVKE